MIDKSESVNWPNVWWILGADHLTYEGLWVISEKNVLHTAHAPNFNFRTECCEFKRCEESKRTLKNPFALRLAEFDTILKLLRITDQWFIVPVKFRFGRNRVFLSLLLLLLAGEPKDGKRFDVDWRLISSASFHTSSDNRERNTQKWNSNNRDCKIETIETLMLLRRSCGIKLREKNALQRSVSKLLNEPPYGRQNQTNRRYMFSNEVII